MGNDVLTKKKSDELATRVNELAYNYSHDRIRMFSLLMEELVLKAEKEKLYQNARDKNGNSEDMYGNEWKRHSIYSGWLSVSKMKQNDLIAAPDTIADGNFYKALDDAVIRYDISKGAFVTFFCETLFWMMKTHFGKIVEHRMNVEPSPSPNNGEEVNEPLIDQVEDPQALEEFNEIEEPHRYIILGRGLIFNLDRYIQSITEKKSSILQGYMKTFYTLEMCAIVKISNKPKSIIYYEKEIIKAVDYDIMHGLYTTICETFKEVRAAQDKYPEYKYSEAKDNVRPCMYHDIVITFIKKTKNGTHITKEQVSKYRKSYNAIIDVIKF